MGTAFPQSHYDQNDMLLQQLREGNELALTEIFNRYWDKLYAAADRVIDDEQASQDIVQEIFINLWERRQHAEIVNLPAYLMQAVKFQVASYFRKNALKAKHHQRIQELVMSVITVDHGMASPDFRESILRLIDGLPPRCKEIFYLSRVDQLSNAEIASRLNISIRTVETQISKALKYIKPVLRNTPAESLLALLLAELTRL